MVKTKMSLYSGSLVSISGGFWLIILGLFWEFFLTIIGIFVLVAIYIENVKSIKQGSSLCIIAGSIAGIYIIFRYQLYAYLRYVFFTIPAILILVGGILVYWEWLQNEKLVKIGLRSNLFLVMIGGVCLLTYGLLYGLLFSWFCTGLCQVNGIITLASGIFILIGIYIDYKNRKIGNQFFIIIEIILMAFLILTIFTNNLILNPLFYVILVIFPVLLILAGSLIPYWNSKKCESL